MSREKQIIEEMAKVMCGNGMSNGNCAMDDEPCNLECVYGCCAEKLYNAGWRKQSEGEWVFEHEYYGKMLCSNCKGEALVNECSEYVDSDYCPNCGAKMKGGAG